ncbi:MAG: Ig domain-containing protein [Gemmatimonadaceae bacterium]
MLGFRRSLAVLTTLASWSCGSTQPDATPEVADIVVNPSAPTLALNAQLPLQALVRNAAGELIPDATVTWTVENAAIASVSPAGVVTGVALGTTQVAANARGKSGIATVTVTRTPVASIVVRPNTANAVIGSKTQLTATAYDAGLNVLTDRGIIWTTSNAAVATVDANGLVTAKAGGTATITATSEGKSDACQLTVSLVPVATISITAGATTIAQNAATTLAATTKDANGTVVTGRAITWQTSDASIVSLSATSGSSVQITGGIADKATITATSEGVAAPISITVSQGQVNSVVVSLGSTTIKPNATTTATAVVYDANQRPLQGRTVSWFASGAATVTPSTSVTSTGENSAATATVKGKNNSASQPATISATISGKSGSATLTVSP